MLLWQEHKELHPQGYQYSQFCHLYRQWTNKIDPVMRQEHRAGEKLFVDYAGQTVQVYDHYYSVPYPLIGKKIDVRITDTTIECF